MTHGEYNYSRHNLIYWDNPSASDIDKLKGIGRKKNNLL